MARSRRSEGSAGDGAEEQASPAPPTATTTSMSQPASLSFEDALASLEGVVARLESGDMPLEQALEAFEAGVALSRRCAATLDAAERRIEILMAERAAGGESGRVETFEALAAEEAGDGDPDGEE